MPSDEVSEVTHAISGPNILPWRRPRAKLVARGGLVRDFGPCRTEQTFELPDDLVHVLGADVSVLVGLVGMFDTPATADVRVDNF